MSFCGNEVDELVVVVVVVVVVLVLKDEDAFLSSCRCFNWGALSKLDLLELFPLVVLQFERNEEEEVVRIGGKVLRVLSGDNVVGVQST